jgi:hypothetical protein
MLQSWISRIAFSACGLLLLPSCGSDSDGPSGGSGGGGEAGSKGGAAVDPKPGCTPASAEDRPDDEFADTDCDGIDGSVKAAVFVSPTGSDEGSGAPTDPVETLQKAVDLASAAGKYVIACNGSYVAPVKMSGAGASIYGGYDCAKAWKRVTDRASIAPVSGIPLTVENVDQELRLERLVLRAPPGLDERDSSSVAAVVVDSTVHFSRVELETQDGRDGYSGAPASHPFVSPPSAGNAPSVFTGTCATTSTHADCAKQAAGGDNAVFNVCANGAQTRGGAGGKGGNYKLNVAYGSGLASSDGTPAGMPGAPGPEGSPGMPARRGVGTIEDNRYVASNAGDPGGYGQTGKSGGGGRGGESFCSMTLDGGCNSTSYYLGGGGGQGGYGGCGGIGGNSGGAGGASIGLIAVNSRVTLEWSVVTTGNGGSGGAPSAGESGRPGQSPGAGAKGGKEQGASTAIASIGRNGAPGGNGGAGGPGGPGGGGPSLGVLFVGTAPTLQETTITLGNPGRGGTGLVGAPGVDGVAQETLDLASIGSDS